jgi:hypothetical protein
MNDELLDGGEVPFAFDASKAAAYGLLIVPPIDPRCNDYEMVAICCSGKGLLAIREFMMSELEDVDIVRTYL